MITPEHRVKYPRLKPVKLTKRYLSSFKVIYLKYCHKDEKLTNTCLYIGKMPMPLLSVDPAFTMPYF
jgi:hypothetical protein